LLGTYVLKENKVTPVGEALLNDPRVDLNQLLVATAVAKNIIYKNCEKRKPCGKDGSTCFRGSHKQIRQLICEMIDPQIEKRPSSEQLKDRLESIINSNDFSNETTLPSNKRSLRSVKAPPLDSPKPVEPKKGRRHARVPLPCAPLPTYASLKQLKTYTSPVPPSVEISVDNVSNRSYQTFFNNTFDYSIPVGDVTTDDVFKTPLKTPFSGRKKHVVKRLFTSSDQTQDSETQSSGTKSNVDENISSGTPSSGGTPLRKRKIMTSCTKRQSKRLQLKMLESNPVANSNGKRIRDCEILLNPVRSSTLSDNVTKTTTSFVTSSTMSKTSSSSSETMMTSSQRTLRSKLKSLWRPGIDTSSPVMTSSATQLPALQRQLFVPPSSHTSSMTSQRSNQIVNNFDSSQFLRTVQIADDVAARSDIFSDDVTAANSSSTVTSPPRLSSSALTMTSSHVQPTTSHAMTSRAAKTRRLLQSDPRTTRSYHAAARLQQVGLQQAVLQQAGLQQAVLQQQQDDTICLRQLLQLRFPNSPHHYPPVQTFPTLNDLPLSPFFPNLSPQSPPLRSSSPIPLPRRQRNLLYNTHLTVQSSQLFHNLVQPQSSQTNSFGRPYWSAPYPTQLASPGALP